MNYYLRHLFEYDRSRSQAGFGFKLEQRLQKENITKNELWDQMENADPTPNKQYVNWLVKAFQEGSKVEDLTSRGADGLKKYELLKKKRLLKPEHTDISRFKTLTDLEDVIDYYDLPVKELIDRGEYEELYKTSTVRILEIFDLTAACYYGQGTRWCTAADTNNKFEYYIERGPLFVILPLKPTYDGEKYQFWYDNEDFKNYELVNEKDDNFKYKKLKSKFPDIIKFFNNLILERIPEDKLYRFIEFIDNPSEELQILSVTKNAFLIKNIENPTEKVQLIAVKEKNYLIEYIKNPTEKVQLEVVKNDGYLILYIDDPSEKVQLAAVNHNYSSIQHIKNPTEAVQMLAVHKAPRSAILYIKNPPEKVQIAAVSQDGYTIRHIEDPSEKVQLASVIQDGTSIMFIENPSEKVQLAAIKQNKDAIKYIENPTEKVIELLKQ